ncbi:hypothetical protein ABVT39_018153 [Epinephelus coioides]
MDNTGCTGGAHSHPPLFVGQVRVVVSVVAPATICHWQMAVYAIVEENDPVSECSLDVELQLEAFSVLLVRRENSGDERRWPLVAEIVELKLELRSIERLIEDHLQWQSALCSQLACLEPPDNQ